MFFPLIIVCYRRLDKSVQFTAATYRRRSNLRRLNTSLLLGQYYWDNSETEFHLPRRLTWTGRRSIYFVLFILGGVIFAACGQTATEMAEAPPQSQRAAVSASSASADTPARAKTQAAATAPTLQSPSRSTPAQILPTAAATSPDATSTESVLPTVAPASVVTPTVISVPQQHVTGIIGTIAASPTPDAQPASTTAPQASTNSEQSSVTPDPDYERALNAARLNTNGWDTDFSLHTVPYSQIKFVIPRDNIPSIDAPKFVAPSEAAWLKEVEPVVSLDIDGDARAYPLQILTWHEIVNDTVGGVPVSRNILSALQFGDSVRQALRRRSA